MSQVWTAQATSTYQDHVIAHVIGATPLGYFQADEALHFALDIGFIWTIMLDCQMALTQEALALSDLNISDEERAALSTDINTLHEEGGATLTHIMPTPEGCLIEEVCLSQREGQRRVAICGEANSLIVEISPLTGEMHIEALTTKEWHRETNLI